MELKRGKIELMLNMEGQVGSAVRGVELKGVAGKSGAVR